jgi:hypothetical protein
MSEAGLFSGVGGGGAGGSAALALKCGRCVFAESTKENGTKCLVVTPQAAQKGALTIAAAGADGVVHLKWTHRETGAVEPDGTCPCRIQRIQTHAHTARERTSASRQ